MYWKQYKHILQTYSYLQCALKVISSLAGAPTLLEAIQTYWPASFLLISVNVRFDPSLESPFFHCVDFWDKKRLRIERTLSIEKDRYTIILLVVRISIEIWLFKAITSLLNIKRLWAEGMTRLLMVFIQKQHWKYS